MRRRSASRDSSLIREMICPGRPFLDVLVTAREMASSNASSGDMDMRLGYHNASCSGSVKIMVASKKNQGPVRVASKKATIRKRKSAADVAAESDIVLSPPLPLEKLMSKAKWHRDRYLKGVLKTHWLGGSAKKAAKRLASAPWTPAWREDEDKYKILLAEMASHPEVLVRMIRYHLLIRCKSKWFGVVDPVAADVIYWIRDNDIVSSGGNASTCHREKYKGKEMILWEWSISCFLRHEAAVDLLKKFRRRFRADLKTGKLSLSLNVTMEWPTTAQEIPERPMLPVSRLARQAKPASTRRKTPTKRLALQGPTPDLLRPREPMFSRSCRRCPGAEAPCRPRSDRWRRFAVAWP